MRFVVCCISWWSMWSMAVWLVRGEDCSSGWSKYESKCYAFTSSTVTYDACDSLCANWRTGGATMLCVEGASENRFITNHIKGITLLGLRKVDGVFTWFDGCNSTYSNWRVGEPNNSGGVETIGELEISGFWNDNQDTNFYCGCEYTLDAPADDDYVPKNITVSTTTTTDDGDSSSSAETFYIVFGIIFGAIFLGVCLGLIGQSLENKVQDEPSAIKQKPASAPQSYYPVEEAPVVYSTPLETLAAHPPQIAYANVVDIEAHHIVNPPVSDDDKRKR